MNVAAAAVLNDFQWSSFSFPLMMHHFFYYCPALAVHLNAMSRKVEHNSSVDDNTDGAEESTRHWAVVCVPLLSISV